ncbi:MAG TPA: hypothetical protein VJ695_05060 [Nitrososphaera sp.]|nr:hypothetical protein [Nitrososphaera sp.]
MSETRDNNSLPVFFETAPNLTNNAMDSVYRQIASWHNNVYAVWQDSVPPGFTNYAIFIKSTNDYGTTFGTPVNFSNNSAFSEHPQIATYDNMVYSIWADDTSGNREVDFTRSEDNMTTFDKISNLSNNTSDSFNQEIAVFADNVYVVWLDQDENDNTDISLKARVDNGATFGRTVNINRNINQETFPKVAAYGGSVYIAWNTVDDSLVETENQGLFFVRSSYGGSTFNNIIKLSQQNKFRELQVAAHDNVVYVVAGGLHSLDIDGVFFAKSTDRGTSFSEPVVIEEDGRFVNP